MLQAHSLYNSCAVREPNGKWREKAFDVQKLYWSDEVSLTYAKQKHITDELKAELQAIRQRCSKWLAHPTEEMEKWPTAIEELSKLSQDQIYSISKTFVQKMRIVSDLCNDEMVRFSRLCVEKAVKLCGESPCKFAAVAIGSIARGETTPYSDLEFIFLVSNKTSKTIPYFERLALTCYFVIGNLGETKLKYMNIQELKNWFNDRAQSGFKIDGLKECAGNIPTGNGGTHAQNRFILTPEQLKKRYKKVASKPKWSKALKGDLSAMMASTKLIYGDPDLLEEFNSFKNEYSNNWERLFANHGMLEQDLSRYEGYMEDLRFMDIKKEIFRYPTLFLFNLKIFCQATSSNSWKVIEELSNKKVLQQPLESSLKLLLSAALYIRMSTYLYHDSQSNYVSVQTEHSQYLESADQWSIPFGLHLYLTMHLRAMKAKYDFGDLNIFAAMLNSPLWKPIHLDPIVAGIALYKALGKMKELEQCVDLLMQLRTEDVPVWLKLVKAEIFSSKQQYGQAIKIMDECLKNDPEAKLDWHIKMRVEAILAKNYLNVQRKDNCGYYARAYSAESIMERQLSSHTKIIYLVLWAEVNVEIGRTEEAEKMCKEALKLCYSTNSSYTLDCNILLMHLYERDGKRTQAVERASKVLQFLNSNEFPTDNEMLETSIMARHTLLTIYKQWEDYTAALENGYLCLELQRERCSDDLDLATSVLKDLASIHMSLSENEEALRLLNNLMKVLQAKIQIGWSQGSWEELELCKTDITTCLLLCGRTEHAERSYVDSLAAQYMGDIEKIPVQEMAKSVIISLEFTDINNN